MLLNTIFEKPVDRHIEGVIKADDAAGCQMTDNMLQPGEIGIACRGDAVGPKCHESRGKRNTN